MRNGTSFWWKPARGEAPRWSRNWALKKLTPPCARMRKRLSRQPWRRPSASSGPAVSGKCSTPRSEEHTSELQSLRHLVCRLLLEKKNKSVFKRDVPALHLAKLAQPLAELFPHGVVVEDADARLLFFFFFNDTATTEIYPLSLHDALPIYERGRAALGRAAELGLTTEFIQ